jgi:hypothetical protein
VTTLHADPAQTPWGLTLTGTQVVWSQKDASGQGQIVMVPKAGPFPQTPAVVVANQTGLGFPLFDGTNTLYWIANGSIFSAPPVAAATVTTVAPAVAPAANGFLAIQGNSLIWDTYGAQGALQGTINAWNRGSQTVSTLATGQSDSFNLAATPDGTAYWTNFDQQTIAAVSTNLGPVETIATELPGAGPRGIFVDGSTVYWTDFGGGSVRYKQVGGLTCTISTGESVPQAIFVDDTYVYWADYVGSGAIRRAPKPQ